MAIKHLPVFLIILIMLLGMLGNASIPNYSDTELENARFVGVVTPIILESYCTPTGVTAMSFPVNGLIPFLYNRNDMFYNKYDVRVYWDGQAVAAAYIPAVLLVYKATGRGEYAGQEIVSRRPSLIALMAVFSGSRHMETNESTQHIEYYRLGNGTLFLRVLSRQIMYVYKVVVRTRSTSRQYIIDKAWAVAAAKISSSLKLYDFSRASFGLAQREAGVTAKIIDWRRTGEEYEYTVVFVIPVYEIDIGYEANVLLRIDQCLHRGQEPRTRTGGEAEPGTSIINVSYYSLNCIGEDALYSDNPPMEQYMGYYLFDAHWCTGRLVLAHEGGGG